MSEPEALTTEPPSSRPGRLAGIPYRWVAMGVVLFGAFMVVLDTTIVNLGLSSLQHDFGTLGVVGGHRLPRPRSASPS